MKVGILPIARPTFDMAFAEEKLAAMIEALEGTGHEVLGSRRPLLDAAATRAAMDALKETEPDRLLVLQATFTDASMTVEAARAFPIAFSIWAVPEPRLGGRLRLNAFCGLNLAAHALGLAGRPFGYLYADPKAPGTRQALHELLGGERQARPVPAASAGDGANAGRLAVDALRGARIGRIGRHPDGFDTCRYDPQALERWIGVAVDEIELPALFERALKIDPSRAAELRARTEKLLRGSNEVDQEQLDRSLRLKAAMEDLCAESGYDALAIRCWPETFTDYGGAACGPVSMMGEAGVPCACEADVHGALTMLLLQSIADRPGFLVDLVDLDAEDGTGVVWHCGQAPISMVDPDFAPRATVHTNRGMPLLFEFPLKPGRVTFFRLSQARGQAVAVIGGGEMLKRPMAFTGTSGVVRFDSPVPTVLERVMGAAIEHHMALAYGDHRDALRAAAKELGIPVLAL